jgi:hypothetical protein
MRGTVSLRDFAVLEGGVDGVAEGSPSFQRMEEEIVFAREALVVNGVFVTVYSKVDLFATKSAGACATNEVDADGVGGLSAGCVRGIADGDQGIIYGVRSFDESQVRLQSEARSFIDRSDLFGGERRTLLVVEGLDVSPLQRGHAHG